MANAIQKSGYSAAQLATIRRTVAKDCNDTEFDLYMEAARSYKLDPFRKQIIAQIFNKDKPDKRQMTLIITRDGYRVKAQRCGNYRPASAPAVFEIDKDLEGPTNPKGILCARVELHWRDPSGEWFPVIGEAYWDEFVPLDFKGNLTGQWKKMPRVMIGKCAEAQALRAGWPDEFSGLYFEEEMAGVEARMTASEAVAEAEKQERLQMLGGADAIMASFDTATNILERVSVDAFADRCAEFIQNSEPADVYEWSIQNREPLKDFWANRKADALELKKLIEAKTAQHVNGAINA